MHVGEQKDALDYIQTLSVPYDEIYLICDHRQRYILIVRQQPKHSRMCGYGEKVDRRPIDPPPIIQLIVPSDEQNSEYGDFDTYLFSPYFFMYASLCAVTSREEIHILKDGKTRSTTGSIVSSLYRLKDLDNTDAAFFVFPDLSVRMEGRYRLKFSLFEIIGERVAYCQCVYSDPFYVYPAKKFPGMEESTVLSRSFADQGLKIRIRKEIRNKKRKMEYDERDNDVGNELCKHTRKMDNDSDLTMISPPLGVGRTEETDNRHLYSFHNHP